MNNRIFKAIYQYMTRKGTTILEDIANEISGGQLFSVDKNDIVIGGKTKKKSIPMSKVMITFEVDLPESGIISISQNQELHRLYIDYVTEQNQNKSNQEYCDISGNKIYCLGNRSHRGLIGRGKLIGVSNHKDTYIGRFSDWGQIIHIGCETSQKVHNMIKYLIESRNHSINLGEDTFCVSWFLGDLTAGGGHIFDDQKIFDSNDEQLFKTVEDWEKYLDNIGYEHQPHQKSIKSSLGGHLAPELNKYFSGQHKYVENKNENQYCVLILGKINDGRISVKYFQSFAIAEIKENVKRWYTDLAWPHRDERTNTKHLEVPSLKKLIELAYGEETNKSIGCKSTKLLRRNLERLIPYVLNNRMLPRDFFQTAVSRLTNRVSYPNCWEEALYRGCSIIKKYKADRGYVVLDKKGVVRMENSTSFVYGRLLATYEKIEMDTMLLNGGAINRSTNAERLWDVMQNRPLYIATLLQRKIMPYQERLGKKQLWVV